MRDAHGERVELHGQTLKPGELVLPMLGSANRDPRQFPDADRFDISREPNPHLAFGYGAISAWGRRCRAWRRGSP